MTRKAYSPLTVKRMDGLHLTGKRSDPGGQHVMAQEADLAGAHTHFSTLMSMPCFCRQPKNCLRSCSLVAWALLVTRLSSGK
jgi:hypothetical protein